MAEKMSEEAQAGRPKRLLRSRRDRVIAGVCGGVAHYIGLDPVLVRLLWVVLTLVTGVGPGVVLYLAAIFIIPESQEEEAEMPRRVPGSVLWGLLLLLVGCYLLWRTFWGEVVVRFLPGWAAAWDFAWGIVRGSAAAVALIGVGLLLLLGLARRGEGAPALVRSRQERVLAGVCGGLGRYFRVDPVWVRLGWVLLTLASFWVGVLAYLAAALLIPEEK
ncbi:MAG: PspC domain-containing protein [Chloroflexia bacterium]